MKQIPHIIIPEKTIMMISGVLAVAGAVKGVSNANLLERRANTVIDGMNNFINVCDTLSKNPFKK